MSSRSIDELPDVSFVVIAYNEEAHVRTCIDSIRAQEGLGRHEIVVVDDGSTDATAAVVRSLASEDPAVRLVSQENRGRGAARVTGVAASSGRLVAMVDADIALPRDWLSACVGALDEHDVVGGTAVPDGDVAYLYNRFRLEPLPAAATTTVTGNNGLYRRNVLVDVGFDATLRNGEDVDLNHRLRARGYRLACLPGLQVEHHEAKSLGRTIAWMLESGQGATRQLAAYREIRPPDVAFAGATILAAVAVAGPARARLLARWTLPFFLVAVSERHLHAKFVPGRGRAAARFAAAVFVNAGFVGAYFMGRLLGVVHRPRASGRPEPLR